jgi:hypothetical protein
MFPGLVFPPDEMRLHRILTVALLFAELAEGQASLGHDGTPLGQPPTVFHPLGEDRACASSSE